MSSSEAASPMRGGSSSHNSPKQQSRQQRQEQKSYNLESFQLDPKQRVSDASNNNNEAPPQEQQKQKPKINPLIPPAMLESSSGDSSSGSSSCGSSDFSSSGAGSHSQVDSENERMIAAASASGYSQEESKGWKNFNKFRYVMGGIVNNNNVQMIIVVLISINAIMMGIGTFDFVKENPPVQAAFERTDQAFLWIFTIEMAMQFIYHGWRLILDGWLVFDLVIIVMSWSFSSVQIIRAFRIFRALRLVTRIKVMKNLMLALFGVMPRMMAIMVLLMLIMYIFSVMFTQLFASLYDEGELEEDYFGRLDDTLFTLFQIMTMDSWAEICRQVMFVPGYGWAWLPFIVFVFLTGFIVVNLIIAVICDAISALHDDEKAKLLGMYDNDIHSEDEYDHSTEDSNDDLDDNGSRLSKSPTDGTREQMQTLEQQIVELSRIQEQTLQTLEHVTLNLQMKKMKKQQAAKEKAAALAAKEAATAGNNNNNNTAASTNKTTTTSKTPSKSSSKQADTPSKQKTSRKKKS